ncbi:prepilin-type N-terminal cleavage/methylation domain-containing protein [Candidatus Saccharibacteria bacterium]|nr:prepilin-type N-terminal cleavage/methylation domain-containing protein [Candidatus Saccharibacteria bacterium]
MNQKGFTIIELLVVIVIIGILVALTLPNLFSAQARGRDTDRKNELKNVQQKLETYFNDNGAYPADFAAAQADAGVTADETTGPRSDAYTYTAVGGGTSYTLAATMENTNDPDAVGGVYTLTSVNQ